MNHMPSNNSQARAITARETSNSAGNPKIVSSWGQHALGDTNESAPITSRPGSASPQSGPPPTAAPAEQKTARALPKQVPTANSGVALASAPHR